MTDFLKWRNVACYIIGYEVGKKTGTPHLQGYAEFPTARRFSTLIKFADGKGHWEVARKPAEANRIYCSKAENFITFGDKMKTPEKIFDPLSDRKLHRWQKDITAMVIKPCDPHCRAIFWLVGALGAEGKTSWAKHMCLKHDALYVSGKAVDMKHAIASIMDKGNSAPRCIILGIPRSRSSLAVSYSGLEELKDGIFFSSKYESRMIMYNTPHVVVLANEMPLFTKLSEDRLKVWDLNTLMDNERKEEIIELQSLIDKADGGGLLTHKDQSDSPPCTPTAPRFARQNPIESYGSPIPPLVSRRPGYFDLSRGIVHGNGFVSTMETVRDELFTGRIPEDFEIQIPNFESDSDEDMDPKKD